MCDHSPDGAELGQVVLTDTGVLGASELAARYGVSPTWARALLANWDAEVTRSAPTAGPRVSRVSERRVVRADDLLRWERDEQAAGRPLPGERRRGPEPRRAAT